MSVDKKKKEREDLPDIDAAWGDSDADAGDRPTLTPPFDLEQYAKITAVPRSKVVVTGETKPAADEPVSAPPDSPAHAEVPFSQRKTPRSMPKLEVARKAAFNEEPASRDNLLAFADRIAPSDRPGAGPEAGSALDLVARRAEAEPATPPPADPVI